MDVRTGTSGWSYAAWRGRFYPDKLPADRMLGAYASRLRAVEVNATFRRVPRPEVLARWRTQVPPGFRFALKAPQRITHARRLAGAEGLAAAFHGASLALGESLGPVLYQLPPTLARDLPALEAFLARLPLGAQVAFEFRHPSWLDDAVLGLLARAGAALCVADTEERETPLVPTAPFGYLRLRRLAYDGPALHGWAERILAQPWTDAFAFFKHEDEALGPAFALALAEVLGEPRPAGPAHP